MSNAENPLSMYWSAYTAQPFPMVRKRKPAIALFSNCFFVLGLYFPVMNTKMKISIDAETNRIPANKKGGNSCTMILLNKYVDPQMM